MSNEVSKKRVFVGLSGGVDSSVSAYLLKKQGYDVTGVFIKAWYPDFIPCNWRDEMRDAMRICAKLGIPFLMCDLEQEYKSKVIDYLISEYKIGNTPNPDIMCNKHIKFDGFFNFAISHGADFIATGHYAKKDETNTKLLIPKDKEKDQTYFLAGMKSGALDKTLFPLCDLEKSEVRKIATKANLHTAIKKDSQGLCFIGHIDLKEFLKNYLQLEKGDVLNEQGEIIGWHEGSIGYTIGQRHGFHLNNKTTNEEKLYVIAKNFEKNTITLGSQFEESSTKEEITLRDFNYLLPQSEIQNAKNLKAKIRYRGEFFEVSKIEFENNLALVKINSLKENIALGQMLVLYSNNQCVGGGIISN